MTSEPGASSSDTPQGGPTSGTPRPTLEDLPAEFTSEIVGRLRMRDLMAITRGEVELTDLQRESFDRAHRTSSTVLVERLGGERQKGVVPMWDSPGFKALRELGKQGRLFPHTTDVGSKFSEISSILNGVQSPGLRALREYAKVTKPATETRSMLAKVAKQTYTALDPPFIEPATFPEVRMSRTLEGLLEHERELSAVIAQREEERVAREYAMHEKLEVMANALVCMNERSEAAAADAARREVQRLLPGALVLLFTVLAGSAALMGTGTAVVVTLTLGAVSALWWLLSGLMGWGVRGRPSQRR